MIISQVFVGLYGEGGGGTSLCHSPCTLTSVISTSLRTYHIFVGFQPHIRDPQIHHEDFAVFC